MALRAGLLFAVAMLLGGCLVPREPATTQAETTFSLYILILVMAGIVFVGVEGFIVFSVFRYRRRDDRLPEQIHGNNRIEVIWTIIPTVIVLIIFVFSMGALGTVQAKSPNPAVTVEVDAFQWQWTFRYRDDDNDPNNDYSVTGSAQQPPVMTLPVGQPIRLVLHSLDVIHSFYVPQFLIKEDVVPVPEGTADNELEFTIERAGTYSGQCAEFCGTGHANMAFSIQAMEQADYDAWIAAARAGESPPPAPPPADATVIELNAKNIAFDTDRIEVPAGKPFIIRFTNQEAVPHNVGIYSGGTELFQGENITGPDTTVDYQVPALEVGEYDFLCTIHPTMNGTLVAQ